jgi:hypothetical protein
MTAPSQRNSAISDRERAETADTNRLPPAERYVAPDGQRVVDQSVGREEEHAVIAEASTRHEALAREQRARQPSTRFWESPRTMVGPLLALLAGVFTLAVRTWPIATPQGHGNVGTAWFLGATIAGALYIVGFFLADRHWQRARLVLICGAVLHLVIGGIASAIVDAQQVAPGTASFLFDAVPAVVALVGAFLVTAPPAAERPR